MTAEDQNKVALGAANPGSGRGSIFLSYRKAAKRRTRVSPLSDSEATGEHFGGSCIDADPGEFVGFLLV